MNVTDLSPELKYSTRMLRQRERWAIADARSSLPLRYRFANANGLKAKTRFNGLKGLCSKPLLDIALRGEIYFKAIRVSDIPLKYLLTQN